MSNLPFAKIAKKIFLAIGWISALRDCLNGQIGRLIKLYIHERKFATVRDYPRGHMNVCVCGQVVLAPKLFHDNCAWCDTHNDYVKNCEND